MISHVNSLFSLLLLYIASYKNSLRNNLETVSLINNVVYVLSTFYIFSMLFLWKYKTSQIYLKILIRYALE